MPQDAFTLRKSAQELSALLSGGKISRINQPEKEELAFLVYTGRKTVKLTVNVNAQECGVYFTRDEQENPLVAPNFCMLLRKHLQNAEILSVDQIGFERILAFTLLCTSDFSSCERILYVEVMGKYSNVTLTEKGIVMGALKTTSLDEGTRRILYPGAKYTLPEKQDKVSPLDEEELRALFFGKQFDEESLADFLFTRVSGISSQTARLIAESYHGGNLADHVLKFIFESPLSPCVVEKNGVPVDFYAVSVSGGIPFETLSDAESYFYGKKRAARLFEGEKRKLAAALRTSRKKCEKRLSIIADKKRECADMELNRIKGELITANLYALKRGMGWCELYNYYDEEGGTMKIRLDEQLTPSQNAGRYYKKYQKQKRTLQALAPQEESALSELDYLDSLASALSSAENTDDLKCIDEELTAIGLLKAPQTKGKKKREEIPFRTYEKEGFTILAGRNNMQNDKLVRSSSPDDLWLHTQKYHSSHVVIRTEGRKIPDEVLLFAARICAKFSDGKSGEKIPVDYCLVKYVKKPSGSKAGFVVYTDYKTLLVNPF